MGFNSTNRIPYISNHTSAKRWYDQIKPIRGSEPPLRPLAARRDKHMQIRENAQGDIECVLYETPVVIFKQDDSVVVTPGKWVSSYTSAFIEGILPGVSVNRTRGMLVLRFNRGNDGKFPLKQGMDLTMRRVENTKWEVQQAEGVGAWSPNRTKANSVRSRYKEMLNYHKGVVLMLTQEREKNNEDDPFEASKLVTLQKQMLADSLGVRGDTDRVLKTPGNTKMGVSPIWETWETQVVDTQLFRRVMQKPTWAGYGDDNDRRASWTAVRDEVLALMRSDQPDDTKYANFTKASMGLLAMRGGADRVELRLSGPTHGVYAHRLDRGSLEVSYSAALSAVNDFLTLAYAEEIMEFKKMPVGRVPTTNYAGLLFQDFKNEGEKA
jgi:hypothetical protein